MVFGSGKTKDVIFITANGIVGHRVATRLLKAGCKVRVGIPNPSDAADLKDQGADVIPFSFEDTDKYASALDSVKSVFFVVDPLLHEGWSVHFVEFWDACRTAGVSHFVKISFYHALTGTRARVMKNFHVALPAENPFQHIPLCKMHGDCDEKLLRQNVMDFTIIFVTHKMSEPVMYQQQSLKEKGEFYGASGGKVVSYVSPNDVAAFSVRVLVDGPKAHKRVGYSLTGPAPITDYAVAECLADELHKPVKYIDMSPAEFEDEERKQQFPDWVIADLVPLEKMKASGLEDGYLSADFPKICGRDAESFEKYLQAKEDMTPSELGLFA